MFDTATAPAENTDGRPKPEGLVDHLIIVRVRDWSQDNPMGITREVKDAAGVITQVPADCIKADIVDLDHENQPMYLDYIFLQAKLIAHFKANVGKTLIGILGKHPDQGQRKGAYYFTDQSKVARNLAIGQAWMANNGAAWNGTASERPAQASLDNQHTSVPRSTLDAMRARNNELDEAPF